MDIFRINRTKGIAVGYVIYGLMFIIIAGMLSIVGGWRGFDDFLQRLEIMGTLLLFLVAAFCLNILLAIGSWKLHALPKSGRISLLVVSIIIPCLLLLRNIHGFWLWYKASLPEGTGNLQIISSSLINPSSV